MSKLRTTLLSIAAVALLSSNGFAYAIASFYTSFFRGLPLLMQVYLIYLGLPQLGFLRIGALDEARLRRADLLTDEAFRCAGLEQKGRGAADEERGDGSLHGIASFTERDSMDS